MKAIHQKVNTIWKGQVAIAKKFCDEARSKNLPLIITHGNDKMTIPSCDIKNGRLGDEMPDQWGRGIYRLIYYRWKPDQGHQATLF